ncbi:MAG: hypothetical protein U0271_10645 [Polyangiaceae bacterium]
MMPGDTQREVRERPTLTEEHTSLALVPIWVLAVRWSRVAPPVRLVINGQTGAVHGKAPLSPVRIAIAVALGLALLVTVLLLSHRGGS